MPVFREFVPRRFIFLLCNRPFHKIKGDRDVYLGFSLGASTRQAFWLTFLTLISTLWLREEAHEQAEEEEGEDLVSKAEAEFFKIVEAEKKALQEAENKRNAAFTEVKQAIAQEGVTHEEYQEGESEEKQSDEVSIN